MEKVTVYNITLTWAAFIGLQIGLIKFTKYRYWMLHHHFIFTSVTRKRLLFKSIFRLLLSPTSLLFFMVSYFLLIFYLSFQDFIQIATFFISHLLNYIVICVCLVLIISSFNTIKTLYKNIGNVFVFYFFLMIFSNVIFFKDGKNDFFLYYNPLTGGSYFLLNDSINHVYFITAYIIFICIAVLLINHLSKKWPIFY